jgi:phage tail tape-measure protein
MQPNPNTPPSDKGIIGKLSDLGSNLTPQFLASQSEVYQEAIKMNATFGQSNQRLSELQQTIFDIRPEITRLGGDMTKVIETIGGVSEATQRNVLITAEDAKELYGTSKIIGYSVQSIVSDFEKVGIQFSKIGDEFEKGMNYIQNLGLNTRQIFQSVTQNIEKLNSFNFANGIQGMSKMAANAAMFKFDMSETFCHI